MGDKLNADIQVYNKITVYVTNIDENNVASGSTKGFVDLRKS